MRNFIKRRIDTFKEVVKTPLPRALSSKSRDAYILGVIAIALGIFTVPKLFSLAILLPILMGLGLILFGYLYKRNIVVTGYRELTGTCIEQKRIVPLGKGADGITVHTEEGPIHVPLSKRKGAPPVGFLVKVYLPNNLNKTDIKGVGHYSTVYGYEVIGGDENAE